MIKVLIIDDDFMVAKVHARFVQQVQGFDVVGVAHTAAQAIVKTQETTPDLILLDIHLPDANGLDLLVTLRAQAPEIDVLVISAAREIETVRRALRGGIVHYLIKPFSQRELLDRLEHHQRTIQDLASVEDHVDQADVNKALGIGRPHRPLPKGCSVETLQLVENLLQRSSADLSSAEAAEALGTSRVSARRYLEYLSEEGRVAVQLRYGGIGRPERRYLWRTTNME